MRVKEPDPPTVIPAAGCCSVSHMLVRSRMKGIDRTGCWRQRKIIVCFVFDVSGVNSERRSFMCSQSRNGLDSCISKRTFNFSCDCGTGDCIILFPSLISGGCSCAGLQVLSSMASTWLLSTATSCHRRDAQRSQRCPWGLEPPLIISSTQQSLWRMGTGVVSVAVRSLSL